VIAVGNAKNLEVCGQSFHEDGKVIAVNINSGETTDAMLVN
jgi:hypothetical protein